MSKMITVAEAAQILEVSTAAIYGYFKSGKLTKSKEGRNVSLAESEVLEFKKTKSTRGKKGTVTKAPAAKAAAKPEATPPTPVTSVQPPDAPLSEVPVGAVIELTNKAIVWRMNPETKTWENSDDVGLSVKVTERRENGGQMFLMCKAAGSLNQWSVAEVDVLNGNLNLIQLPTVIPQTPPNVGPPEPTPESTPEEPVVDKAADKAAAAAAKAEKEEMEKKIAYSSSLHAYVASNEARLASASSFKKIDKEHRPIIWGYLEEKGEESEEGKKDKVVEDFGYRAIITFTEGRNVTEYNMAEIVSWLLTNQHTGVLTYSVDIAKWNELKETGVVPAEFIATVEAPKKLDDARKLVINKVRGKDDEKK